MGARELQNRSFTQVVSLWTVPEEADPTNNCSTAVPVTVPEPVPALPLLGHLLLALGLTGAGARVMRRRQRVSPGA